jgi:hypothetical protein
LGKWGKFAVLIVVYAVVQLVEVLVYKPVGHVFYSQSRNWNFHQPNNSDRAMVLEWTQPLTKMTASSICWGSKGEGCRFFYLTTFM